MSDKPKFNSREYWQERTKDSSTDPITSPKEYPVSGGVVLRRAYAGEVGFKFTPDIEKRDRLLAERALRDAQMPATHDRDAGGADAASKTAADIEASQR